MVGGQVWEIPGPFPAQNSGHQSLSGAGSGRPRPPGGTEEGGWPLEAWAQALTYGAEGELTRWMRVASGHRGSKGKLQWPRWGGGDRGHTGTPLRHGGRRADSRLALSVRPPPPPPRPGWGGHRRPNWSLPPRDSAGLLLCWCFSSFRSIFFFSLKEKKNTPIYLGAADGGGGQGTLEALASWLFQAAVAAQRQGPHVGG